jgi:NAD(P)H-hydrate epimerase
VLILAGSVGKSGAAALAALAAQRSGAGLVTVGTPASLHDILEGKLTEAMTEPLPETEARSLGLEGLERILRLAEGKSVVAIGPGLSTHPSTQELIRRLVAALPLPMVLDADGITAFAGQAERLATAGGPVILTPHPGEFSRLLGVGRDECLRERLTLVPAAAARLKATLLLKTARSLVGTPDGAVAVVGRGNPGMATGGSGDVLTGLIAGLVAQGRAPALATRAGAYLHALAGDLAAARLGEEAVIASDLIRELPAAMARLKRGETDPLGLACRTPSAPGGEAQRG